ncbi:MAG: phage head closure protein, partial [Candidatus Anammoxibacter sp.]
MRAGKLDKRIIFQTKTTSRNDYGEEAVTSWSDTFTEWGSVVELKGKETFEASQLVQKADIRLRIRYRTDVDNEMRFVYNSNYYDIYSQAELGRQDGLEIFGT